MMGSHRDRRGRLTASAAALTLLLAGCSAPGPASGSPTSAVPTPAASSAESTSAPSDGEAASSPAGAASSSGDVAEETEGTAPATESEGASQQDEADPVGEAEEADEADTEGKPAEATATDAEAAPAEDEASAGPEEPEALAESLPLTLAAPAIGLESELLHLGLREDGSLDVPPGDQGSPAGWYENSPTPGERGPAVLLGHVSAYGNGDGVFRHLSELEPGDEIEVLREDGTTAVFAVDRGQKYDKGEFPTDEVYGNTAGPELRLITCDGYNMWTRTFEENYIVFATFTEVR